MTEQQRVYTVDEVARILRISRSSVRNMVRDGRLPRVEGLKIDRVLIPAWAVDERLAPPENWKMDDKRVQGQEEEFDLDAILGDDDNEDADAGYTGDFGGNKESTPKRKAEVAFDSLAQQFQDIYGMTPEEVLEYGRKERERDDRGFPQSVLEDVFKSRRFWGSTFYIEGALGRYAEMVYYGHIMVLDDVAGQGYFDLYDSESGDEISQVEFDKNDLPSIWPVYYALAAKCKTETEPFIHDEFADDLAKVKRYVETGVFRDAPQTISQDIPKGLYTNLEVIKLTWSGMTYSDAVAVVALSRNVLKSTIRDACERQLGMRTAQFIELIKDRDRVIDYLVKKFPDWKGVIVKELS